MIAVDCRIACVALADCAKSSNIVCVVCGNISHKYATNFVLWNRTIMENASLSIFFRIKTSYFKMHKMRFSARRAAKSTSLDAVVCRR